MNQIRRTNQVGSIIPFIVVGVVLALGLIAGIYIVRQQGEQARQDQLIAVVNQQTATEDGNDSNKPVPATNPTVEKTDNDAVVVPVAPVVSEESEDLPITGPELSIGELIGAGLLTTFLVSYLGSRRKSFRSL